MEELPVVVSWLEEGGGDQRAYLGRTWDLPGPTWGGRGTTWTNGPLTRAARPPVPVSGVDR